MLGKEMPSPSAPFSSYHRDVSCVQSQFSIESDSGMTESTGLIQEYDVFDPERPRPKMVFVIGGPGSGKGTQSRRLATHFGFVGVSVGEILRAQMLRRVTSDKKWELIAKIIADGELAPSETTVEELKQQFIRHPEAKGFVVDGFPRDIGQAFLFEEQPPDGKRQRIEELASRQTLPLDLSDSTGGFETWLSLATTNHPEITTLVQPAFNNATILTFLGVLNSLGCVPEPMRKDQAVRVFYTTSVVPVGCQARGPIDRDLEVHVLNLRYSRSQMATLQLNVSSGAAQGECKAAFILNANSSFVLTIHSDEGCRLLVIHGPRSYVMPSSHHNSTATNLPFSGEQLLMWAKETYGGVSSFAELEDPQRILFQLCQEPSAKEDCILAQNFNAESYLEVEVLSHKVETCLDSHKASGNVAHILWLQQSPSDERMQTVELNIKTVCKDGWEQKAELPMALWLKSPQNTLWKMGHGFSFVQLLASGKYSFATWSGVHNGTMLPDNKEELIQKARNNSFVASYTDPSAKTISLEYKRICGSTIVTTTPPPQMAENLTVKVHQLINLCKPWKCLDSSIEIALLKIYLAALPTRVDAITLKDRCRARDNTTHFVLNSILDKCSTQLEGGVHVKNQLILTLPVSPGKVTVPFECDLPEKVSLQLYNSEDFNAPSTPVIQAHQITYVEVSLRTAMKQFSLEMGDCFLKPRDSQLLFHQGVSLSYSVETLKSPSPKTQRFSFTYKPEEELWSIDSATLVCVVHLNTSNDKRRSYEGSLDVMLKNYNPGSHNQGLRISTVLGIAFGAFLIGVLLTGALWFIYSHTRPIAKTQPALANTPASESSSTNHSLGSTQSTPCSTSSMA
ncbi:LOW QUALITY PROTEIN: endoglin [Vipera latastei]